MKTTGLETYIFHESPDAPGRRTAAAVVDGSTAYVALARVSKQDHYSRKVGNAIALQRAVNFKQVAESNQYSLLLGRYGRRKYFVQMELSPNVSNGARAAELLGALTAMFQFKPRSPERVRPEPMQPEARLDPPF
jgi:hypothetical protein